MARKKHKKRMPSGICIVKSTKALRRLLKRHGVNHGDWGKGYTKDLRALMKEIRIGESVLLVKRGVLVRQVRHAQASITCDVDGITYRLIEARQVFVTGAERIREGKDRSVSEKIRAKESTKAAMTRGILEELGLDAGRGVVRDASRPRRRTSDSAASYPGLAVIHIEFQFTWKMPAAYFCADGYVEVQTRKTTYFTWIVQ